MHDNGDAPAQASRGFDSLAARARVRREELSARRTIQLLVPGYQDMLEMEYRALTYREVKHITNRTERIRDEAAQDLAAYADQLLLASTQAWEVAPDGTRTELSSAGWTMELMVALGVEPGMTMRQSLMAVLTDVLLIQHYAEYSQWLQGAEYDIDNEAAQDFPKTTA
jgi:hypothetical protein